MTVLVLQFRYLYYYVSGVYIIYYSFRWNYQNKPNGYLDWDRNKFICMMREEVYLKSWQNNKTIFLLPNTVIKTSISYNFIIFWQKYINTWKTFNCQVTNTTFEEIRHKYDSAFLTHLRLRLNKLCLSHNINWQHVVRRAALCMRLALSAYSRKTPLPVIAAWLRHFSRLFFISRILIVTVWTLLTLQSNRD